jgi:serine/threonine-protein kinase
MGVVYVVEHVHTGDTLALKVLLGNAAKDPKSVDRFKREARASARIKSEHVVRVVDADVAPELDGAPFLVMELLNGSDLERRIQQTGRLSPAEAIHYLTQAASALDKSHAAGIVHRDLKPENLFLHTREDGTTILKILDFGISKLVGDTGNEIAGASATKTGAIMGTPLYMSPEQARGRISEIGPATDIWAMGLIGLQLLTGEIYWRANTVAELMSQILSEPFYPAFERWPWLPPTVDTWFQRSCARDPKARFQSVGEQVSALAAALRGEAPLVPTAGAAPVAIAVALPGTRTTTGAVSQDATSLGTPEERTPRPRGSAAPVLAGVVILMVAGSGFAIRQHYASVAAATAASAAASAASSAPSAPLAAASEVPSGVPRAVASAPPVLAPSGSAVPSAVAPLAPAVAAGGAGGARHGGTHAAPVASHAPAVAAPVAPPATEPKKNGGRFDPTSM